ncbi:unnamed protein product [Urochloa humidicola]
MSQSFCPTRKPISLFRRLSLHNCRTKITIENKQQLDLQINKSAKDEDHIDLSAQPAQQIQHLNPDDQFGGTAVIQQADTTSMSGCPPEKVSSSNQDGGNQKQGGGGKKLLISK